MSAESKTPLDLAAIAAKAASEDGRRLWRSLEELACTPEYEAFLHNEFPNDPEKEPKAANNGFHRRDVLKLMAASAALFRLSGCTKLPAEKINSLRASSRRDNSRQAPFLRHVHGGSRRGHRSTRGRPHGKADQGRREPRSPGEFGSQQYFLPGFRADAVGPGSLAGGVARRPHQRLARISRHDHRDDLRAPT